MREYEKDHYGCLLAVAFALMALTGLVFGAGIYKEAIVSEVIQCPTK